MKNLKILRLIGVWFLVLLSVLPVLFMFWLSILGAEDIQQTAYFPQRRGDRVTFFAQQKNNATGIAATSQGNIYGFSLEDNYSMKKIADINSVATAYAQNDKFLWALSANKGLVEIYLKGGTRRNSYDWDFFKKSYENFDPTRFYVSNDIMPEYYERMAQSLNNEQALPKEYEEYSKDYSRSTVSTLANLRFYESQEIINQLNWLLTNDRVLNIVLNHWKKWDGWLNPQIHRLFKEKKLTEKEKRFLFRYCLSELFPNRISRFKYFEWQDIWINQVAISGLSVLAINDKVIMGIAGESFPGIAILDVEARRISWITETIGLPNASIKNIVQISDYEVLVSHDVGFSIVQLDAEKVTHNFMFGEYGLPHLDDQRLYIKAISKDEISVSYENSSFNFNFRKFGTSPAERTVLSPSISSYYNNEDGETWIGYENGNLEILDSENNQIMSSTVPLGRRSLQWSNYQDIMRITHITIFVKNSIFISLSISILCTLIAIFPSYAIARLSFFGKSALSKIMMFSHVLSSLPFLIPIFVIFIMLQMKSFQMFNNPATIILVNIAFFMPITVQFLTNIFKSFPQNLEDSAIIDGCTPWTTFFKIILPSALPALSTCLAYIFLLAWDEILFIWILSADSSTATLPVGIRMTVGQLANRPELLMAFAVIASTPPLLLFGILRSVLFKNLLRSG